MTKLLANHYTHVLVENANASERFWAVNKTKFSLHIGDSVVIKDSKNQNRIGRIIRRTRVAPSAIVYNTVTHTNNQFPVADQPVQPVVTLPQRNMINSEILEIEKEVTKDFFKGKPVSTDTIHSILEILRKINNA